MSETFIDVSLDGKPDLSQISNQLKAQLCNEWLAYCWRVGWTNDAMPHLAKFFWEQEGWRTFTGFKP